MSMVFSNRSSLNSSKNRELNLSRRKKDLQSRYYPHNNQKKVKAKEIAGYIESLKKASSKNNNISGLKGKQRDLSQQRPSLRNKRDLLVRKSRQKIARRADKIVTNTRRISNSNHPKFLQMGDSPEYSANRFKVGKILNGSSSFIKNPNYQDQTKLMDSSMRMMRMRQSESTKPARNMRITDKPSSKVRNSKMRANSNPRLGNRDMHSNSSASFKGRKGQLMSSSKLGKIINDQTNNILEQKVRILNPGNISKKMRYSQLQYNDSREVLNNSGEWSNKIKVNTEMFGKIPPGLMSTEVGKRKERGAEDFSRGKKEATSHSLLGNIHPNEHRLKKQLLKDNSTVPIKYDTTAVISEEYSNFDDPFTQMYTNSILSGNKAEKNIEEMHYLQINLCKMTRKMLEKTEKAESEAHPNPRKPQADTSNLLELCSETSIE
ncbi:unnamed protein product [Moneuplotes crassus]|uniref:Uncharacterized protein n=1 Tax=Euplotes crassus TaxID=5936 RepID=A0AAD1UIW6_EUPCR|nr:unnamed protein product [Moneuplotes crassus]